MRWKFAIAAFAISCFHAQLGQAQDGQLILDKMNNTIVSGTITRVEGESVFITYAGRDFEIEMDDLDVDNINDLFAPGMQITAKGVIEDDGHTPAMDASEVVRADVGSLDGSEALFLLNEDND